MTTTTDKATPRPWYAYKRHITADSEQTVLIGGTNAFDVGFAAADANISLIVKAVNNFDAMKEALELLLDAYGEAHALHDLGECNGSLRARAILAKIEGER
jgi:hypothetical protein